MKAYIFLLLAILAFSCQTNYYVSKPIKRVPAIGLQSGLKTNGMLIACDANMGTDTAYFEKCLHSLKWYIEAKSSVKIVDEILFHKSPNIAVLTELRTKYKVDGLLLLTDLNVQKYCVEVPSGHWEVRDNRMPEPYLEISKVMSTVTNVEAGVTSVWEYYDFTTSQSYRFRIMNDDVLELGEHVSDLETYMENDMELLHPLFYQNGTLTASTLIEK